MKVYLTLDQWIDFVTGKTVIARKEESEKHYKGILVGFSEILDQDFETVTIIKRY